MREETGERVSGMVSGCSSAIFFGLEGMFIDVSLISIDFLWFLLVQLGSQSNTIQNHLVKSPKIKNVIKNHKYHPKIQNNIQQRHPKRSSPKGPPWRVHFLLPSAVCVCTYIHWYLKDALALFSDMRSDMGYCNDFFHRTWSLYCWKWTVHPV